MILICVCRQMILSRWQTAAESLLLFPGTVTHRDPSRVSVKVMVWVAVS